MTNKDFLEKISSIEGVYIPSFYDVTYNEDNIVKEVKFLGGCNGNTTGISKLVIGMEVDEVINRLENIRCGFKTTSCPDQLAKALKEIKENA